MFSCAHFLSTSHTHSLTNSHIPTPPTPHHYTHTQELLPPPEYDSTSSDSSEGEDLPEIVYGDQQWELGGTDTFDNKDIYDLYDEPSPEGKGRKHSVVKRLVEQKYTL